MKELVKALAGTLARQLEDIEKKVDFESLLEPNDLNIDEEARYLQEQIKALKQRLADVIDDTAAGVDNSPD